MYALLFWKGLVCLFSTILIQTSCADNSTLDNVALNLTSSTPLESFTRHGYTFFASYSSTVSIPASLPSDFKFLLRSIASDFNHQNPAQQVDTLRVYSDDLLREGGRTEITAKWVRGHPNPPTNAIASWMIGQIVEAVQIWWRAANGHPVNWIVQRNGIDILRIKIRWTAGTQFHLQAGRFWLDSWNYPDQSLSVDKVLGLYDAEIQTIDQHALEVGEDLAIENHATYEANFQGLGLTTDFSRSADPWPVFYWSEFRGVIVNLRNRITQQGRAYACYVNIQIYDNAQLLDVGYIILKDYRNYVEGASSNSSIHNTVLNANKIGVERARPNITSENIHPGESIMATS